MGHSAGVQGLCPRLRRLLLASTIAGVLLGCESVTFPREGLVQLSAADHSAWTVVPEHLDVNRPTNLVILLHDAGSNGHRMLLRSGIDQHALASGCVAMAPDLKPDASPEYVRDMVIEGQAWLSRRARLGNTFLVGHGRGAEIAFEAAGMHLELDGLAAASGVRSRGLRAVDSTSTPVASPPPLFDTVMV